MKNANKKPFWNGKIKGKKGVNDMSLLTIWTMFLFFSSVFIVFVNDEFQTTGSTFNTDGFTVVAVQDSESVGSLNPVKILSTMLALSTFDVTNSLGLPFWLVGFYSILGVLLIVLLARNFIPFIGGG